MPFVPVTSPKTVTSANVSGLVP